jgi:hypothetical protein
MLLTITITASEYASLYGCSTSFVTRNLRKGIGMTAMLSWRKSEGKTGPWMVEVLISWWNLKKTENKHRF